MKKLLSLLGLGLLVFMFSGCGQEKASNEDIINDELLEATDLDMADEEVSIDPSEEIGTPSEVVEELEEPTTAPPTE